MILRRPKLVSQRPRDTPRRLDAQLTHRVRRWREEEPSKAETQRMHRDDLHDEMGEDAVEIPITDVLDLHSFRPAEIASVVHEYLDRAYELGLSRLRIIHGRGKGVQRNTVRTLLSRDHRVAGFGDAPGEAGGWGATWVELGSEPDTPRQRAER